MTNADGMTVAEIASKVQFYKTAYWAERGEWVGIVGSITSDIHGLTHVVVRTTGHVSNNKHLVEPLLLSHYGL